MLPTSPVVALGPTPLAARISGNLSGERAAVSSARETIPCPEATIGRGRQKPSPSLPAWMGVRGFIDIHCHVVPGLDDGPETLSAAVELAHAAYRWGTMAVIATPYRSLRYGWSRGARRQALDRLESYLPGDLALFAGCELELSDEAWQCFEEEPRCYSLNSSRYVLLELPQAGAGRSFEPVLEQLQARGFVPIVAHAERCHALARRVEQFARWVRQGCLLQLTADAVCGRRGASALATATALLRAGLAHFVASDAHDATRRGPNLQPAYRAVSELLGIECAARLFMYHPLRVLQDEPIDVCAAAAVDSA